MKQIILILALGLTSLSGFSQIKNSTIKISNDLELIKISDNAYIHVSYTDLPEYGRTSANGLIFINNTKAFLFDTPWNDSLTMVLVTWLKDNLGLRVTGFVPNHWHEDCMGGLAYLQNQSIPSYANQKTIDLASSKNLPVPEYGFPDSLQLHMGDKEIDCYFLGAAHSLDNIVIWIPSDKILFPGCMVKSLNSQNLGNTADGDISSYPTTIDNIIKKFKTAEIVIPGHGQAGGTDLLWHTKELCAVDRK
jgi:metallo-beta-lactamase class B